MGVLERWDRRNQRVLEEHNRRPFDASGLAMVASLFVTGAVLRISRQLIDGWQGWAAGLVLGFVVSLAVVKLVERSRAGTAEAQESG